MADEADRAAFEGLGLMHAFLCTATDEDLERMARVISPELGLTPGQRRAGFELLVNDIASRIKPPGGGGVIVFTRKDGEERPRYEAHAGSFSASQGAALADSVARGMRGDGAMVTAFVTEVRESRVYRDGVLLQSGRKVSFEEPTPGDDEALEAGEAIAFTRDVHRPPHAVVPAGATGTVESVSADHVVIVLDEPVPGLEAWGNRVHYHPEFDQLWKATFAQSVRADVEPTAPSPTP